jgi:hypothetical protein
MLSKVYGLVRPEGFDKLIKFIGSQTSQLLTCSVVHQPQCYRVPLVQTNKDKKGRAQWKQTKMTLSEGIKAGNNTAETRL